MHGTALSGPYPGYVHGTHPEICPSGCIPKPMPTDEVSDVTLLREAREFIAIYSKEKALSADYAHGRFVEIEASVKITGAYDLSVDELEFGAQLSWRNAPKCANRSKYQELTVLDCRHVQTNTGAFESILEMLDASISSGATIARMAVFRPKQKNEKQGPRIWNKMILRFAGYRLLSGEVLGDPVDVDFTEMLQKRFGWIPPDPKTAWDVLPILMQLDETKCPELFKLPSTHVPIVHVRHPDMPGLNSLNLRWFGIPVVSSLELTIGGLQFTAIPFLGWFADNEVRLFIILRTSHHSVPFFYFRRSFAT